MMDTGYFGFKNTPFQGGLNPRNFYSTAACEAAYKSIARGLEARCGMVMVSGPAGIGKSALLLAKMAELSRIAHCIFFSGVGLSLEDVLDEICLELMGLTLVRQSTAEQIQMIKECLAQQPDQQRTIAIVIDNAEDLAESVLNALLSLEDSPAGTRVVQVILLGLPSIINRFRPVTETQELIPVHCRITPLSDYDVDPFIKHQLQAHGYDNKRPLFLPPAVEAIAAYTSGVPAAINMLCDATLTLAPKHRTKTLTKEIVNEAWMLCADEIKQTTAETEPPEPSLLSKHRPTPERLDTNIIVTKTAIVPDIRPDRSNATPPPPLRNIQPAPTSPLPADSSKIPQFVPQQEQIPQVTDDQCHLLKVKANRSRHFLLVGALIFIVVLVGEGFMLLSYEPTPVVQAQKLQLLPQRSIAIAQQAVQSNPSVDRDIVEPTQTFIHSPLPGPNLSPDVNFVEITDSVNPASALHEFPDSGEYEQETMEEPVIPATDKNSPFIELK